MADEIICSKCNSPNPKDTVFCGKCGERLVDDSSSDAKEDPLIGSFVGDRFLVHEKLGEGGMGVVYRAEQTAIQREVALKVLPAAWARDAERMARFQQEAQVLASLNHPHIAQIFGLEESGGVRALVLELVEGPTLGERIRAGGPTVALN